MRYFTLVFIIVISDFTEKVKEFLHGGGYRIERDGRRRLQVVSISTMAAAEELPSRPAQHKGPAQSRPSHPEQINYLI